MNEDKKEKKTKEEYITPVIESEPLMAFAAVCNGNATGGRKASTDTPDFCRADRLNS